MIKIIRKMIDKKVNVKPLSEKSMKMTEDDYYENECPNQIIERFCILDEIDITDRGYVDIIFNTNKAIAIINRFNQNAGQQKCSSQWKEEALKK